MFGIVSKDIRTQLAYLNSLRSTEIRELLVTAGAKGFRSAPELCPLASYLRATVGNPHVIVTGTSISYHDIEKDVTTDDGKTMGISYVETSPSVRLFIRRFDAGECPELEA